jgi:CheY-like chemotaxis protein
MHSLDITKPFGAAVKSWRNRLCISQEELAGRAGLHRTYISDIERGARNVSLVSIEKLARALEISAAMLFSYDDASGQPALGKSVGEGMVDILLVEDDVHDAEMAAEALKVIGNFVQVARDGQAALDFLFCQGEYANRKISRREQLVLLDLGLPRVGGLEVLQRLKSDPRTANIPVVVLTGSDHDRDIQMSKRLGAAAYIVKPVVMNNLAHVTSNLNFQWTLVKPQPRLEVRSAV